ncbi:tubulin epsilon and delta complex protein 1 isoform X2 [Ochotona curzoniae]|uniref:tubulin epsilon and delta complex protein 1 isoform X2 n=1 Tax=Ochotona curzoniae TaxID=130825 RepID=UPI001B349B7C|nr:tubulin epsilon and delta complex protein 1 isoform X2 [Ochotona curzoniae]
MARWRRRVRGAAALPEAVAALSRALPAAPSPETFRRAKFDRPEAAAALWSLLARVLSALPAPAVPASLGPEARWVKAALRAQGYQRRALWELPEDGSRGSRELLLALSWLLARGPLLEQLLAQTRVQLGDRMPAFQCELPARPGPAAPSVAPEGPLDVRLVQWLMGTLRLRWQGLMCSQQEHAALLSKLLQALESENARLEAAMHWRGSQLVYWQWLDTILDICPAGAPTPASPPACLPRIPKRGVDEWELLERDLQGLQEELREAAEPRRAAWEARVDGQGQGPQWSRSRQAVREAVSQALASLQQSWEEGGIPAQPLGPHRLVRSEDGMLSSQGLRATEVISLLRSQEACLEALLCQLQEQCRRELARLAGTLPGLVWIPAPGR